MAWPFDAAPERLIWAAWPTATRQLATCTYSASGTEGRGTSTTWRFILCDVHSAVAEKFLTVRKAVAAIKDVAVLAVLSRSYVAPGSDAAWAYTRK
jgi:hypothetical protein